MVSHIKCPNCGTFNTNADYCKNCGTPLSYEERRALEHAKETDERRERERIQSEKKPSFYLKYKDHRFLIVRVLVKSGYSVWVAFVAVGMFIAWLITAIAA